MCTSISYTTKDHYFGRNLDMECSFGEKIIITPKNYSFKFKHLRENNEHFAMIGIGITKDDYPLYYEATNEKGLSMAGLSFKTSAVYNDFDIDKENVCVFELIPYILGNCSTVDEARERLEIINIVSTPFNEELQTTELHWMISDRDYSITVECVQDGLKIYYNPVHVLTNNPEFPMQMFNLNNYMSLTREEPETRFAEGFDFNKYSRGMGAFGLPGDLSSMSRFVRAAFTRLNSVCDDTEDDSISQFFHILQSVSQSNGCARAGDTFEKTIYSSCCNTDKGIFYYTTYHNNQISAIDIHRENLDNNQLIIYNLVNEQNINFHN